MAFIKTRKGKIMLRRMWRKATLLHCSENADLSWFTEISMEVSLTTENTIPSVPAVSFMGLCPKAANTRDTYTPIDIVLLLCVCVCLYMCMCVSVLFNHKEEYNLLISRKWIKLENIILSETSQKHKWPNQRTEKPKTRRGAEGRGGTLETV